MQDGFEGPPISEEEKVPQLTKQTDNQADIAKMLDGFRLDLANTEPPTTEENRITELEKLLAEENEKIAQLESALVKEKTRADTAEANAATDALTGLLSRRVILELLSSELGKLERKSGNGRLAVIYLDVDHFKKINDEYGHIQGDRVLKGVAEALKGTIRGSDSLGKNSSDITANMVENSPSDDPENSGDVEKAGRLGGEEFILLLSLNEGTTDEEIQRILTRYMTKISTVSRSGREGDPVTASFGCVIVSHSLPPEEVLAAADQTMYKSKEAGRNRAMIAVLDERGINITATVLGPLSESRNNTSTAAE